MHLYRVTVNLNGNSDNQVVKEDVTAAEIRLLQYIHGKSENGKPPVENIEHVATTNRTDRQERQRLFQIYRELELDTGAAIIEKIFGVAGVPLPQVYEPPVFVEQADDTTEDVPIEEVITPVEAVKPTIKVSKPKPAKALDVEAIVG
jgi:hypothetical protein